MSTLATLFKNIDEFIFAKVDQLKGNPYYQDLVARIEVLNTKAKKIINQIGTILFIILPILFVLFFFISNSMIRSDVNTKKEIFQLISQITANKNKLESIERNAVSPFPIETRANLQTKIQGILNKIGIANSKVQIKNFAKPAGQTGPISKAQADLNFSDFSTNDLTQLTLRLLQYEKMKISEVEISKNKKKNNLFGSLHLVHYGKVKQ